MRFFKRAPRHVMYPNERSKGGKIIPGLTPTSITCEPGSDRGHIIATEYWSMKMIGDLANCFPVVHILRENDDVIEATFPIEWLKIQWPGPAEDEVEEVDGPEYEDDESSFDGYKK